MCGGDFSAGWNGPHHDDNGRGAISLKDGGSSVRAVAQDEGVGGRAVRLLRSLLISFLMSHSLGDWMTHGRPEQRSVDLSRPHFVAPALRFLLRHRKGQFGRLPAL